MATAVADWTGDDEPGLMARIVALHLVASHQLDEIAARHGISFADYLVLGVIRRSADEACAPSTVCEVLRRTSGGMTLTLDRLQAAGRVRREPDPHDRRKVLLRLTPAGRKLAVTVNEALHEWENAIGGSRRRKTMTAAIDELLALLDPEERASLVR